MNLSAAQALSPADEDKRPREEAVDWLRGYLGDCARPSADAIKEAGKVGIKERTLERARQKLGVVAWFRKHTNHWVIALPEVAKRMQEEDGHRGVRPPHPQIWMLDFIERPPHRHLFKRWRCGGVKRTRAPFYLA